MARLFRFLGWYLALTFAASLGLLILALPNHPKTLSGWLWFFLLALPVTLVGELIGEGIWRNPVAKAIEKESSNRQFSWLRIAYGFVAMLLIFGVVWGLALFLGIDR